MSYVDLGLSYYERGGNSDSRILVHGVKQPVVHLEAHDVAGRLAGSTGPSNNANAMEISLEPINEL